MENTKKTIKIDSALDLAKIPFNTLSSIPITSFSGKYYNKLYEEALKLEKSQLTNNNNNNAIQIEFLDIEINRNLNFGEYMIMTGSSQLLGSWNPFSGLKMIWNEGNNWNSKIKPENLEFKFVIMGGSEMVWEDRANRVINMDKINEKVNENTMFVLDSMTYNYQNQERTLKISCRWNN